MEDVKYLPSDINGDVIFILSSMDGGVLDVYGKAMDGMDIIYDRHAWSKTKTTNIQNEIGLIFRRPSYIIIYNAPMILVGISHVIVGIVIIQNGLVLPPLYL